MPDSTLALIVPLGGGFPGYPSHPLPEPPLYPTGGPIPPGGPVDPGWSGGLPVPPPGVWGPPPRPGHGLPSPPPGGHIDNSLPIVPGIPVYPGNALPTDPGIDNTLPLEPGTIWPPLPPELGTGKVIALVIVYGVGYRWAVLDLSLKPGTPLPPSPQPK